MKKILVFVVAVGVIFGILYFFDKREVMAPTVVSREENVKITTETVEKYLRENITKLSPVQAVLGGTWYVTSVVVDLEKNSGTVTYEDGHIEEKKNFTYTANEKGEVASLIIK